MFPLKFICLENDNEDNVSILKGWKFLIRVWDKEQDENGNWKIKIPWSDDPAQIKGLANGDKVEWKLVSADGNPVKDAYYNTIALKNNQDTNGNMDYKFAQVNYLNGQTSYQIVKEGIGSYPEYENQYPENSGFVISGLQPAFDVFKIDQEGFKSVISELNLFYTGFDKQGTINIDNKYLENDYWVNTQGQVYLKDQNQFKLNNKTEELIEVPIKEFLEHVTFFTQDPLLYPYQNGFKFKTNDVNIDNHLTNGDQVWAQFDMVSPNDQKNLKTNENINSIIFRLPDVNGLTNASDPMSPLVYVFIGLAAIMTLGISSLLAFFISRNKKLKDKK